MDLMDQTKWRRPANHVLLLLGVLVLASVAAGCSDAAPEFDADQHVFYGQGQDVAVEEPIGFTDQNYAFTGDTPIADLPQMLADQINTSNYYAYGFSADSDLYPVGDNRQASFDCDFDPDDRFSSMITPIDGLPTQIEGVATLHPRYFQKVSVCGQDQRFYGAFFLQDSSGGILVLKDSRVADFTFGSRVSLRVRGLVKFYDTYAVLVYDQQQTIDPSTHHDVYYETVTGRDLGDQDHGRVRRVTGEITGVPTAGNFNEMRLTSDDGQHEWVVSIDRHLGQRNIGFNRGRRVQVTGPVMESYGDSVVLLASLGQVEFLDGATPQ